MTIKDIEKYCLDKKGAFVDFPFGEDVEVLKLADKMFALISLRELPLKISLKCEPSYAEELRSMYDAIIPGYHLNKKHWNTITVDESISKKLLFSLIDHSYNLIKSKLSKSKQKELDKSK